eukprot:TRINITY_DN44173_c0_g1_i1.p1 TRINITY_DN44173_c0_g1~~TRINITY_DN44173_c0_g1_i1.p1  ORF type:complete len:302 (-),score=57.66 TRINITY_DN44173_c0_g1_i1:112-1017(-)
MYEHPKLSAEASERSWNHYRATSPSFLPNEDQLPPSPWGTRKGRPLIADDEKTETKLVWNKEYREGFDRPQLFSELRKPTSPMAMNPFTELSFPVSANIKDYLPTPPDQEKLIRSVGSRVVTWGEPFQLECRLSVAARSEIKRKSGNIGLDARCRRKAFLVALDAGLLKARAPIKVQLAARKKPVAVDCQCAHRVELNADEFRFQPVTLAVTPQLPVGDMLSSTGSDAGLSESDVSAGEFDVTTPGGRRADKSCARVLLQIVVESTMDKHQWLPFGSLFEIKVRPRVPEPDSRPSSPVAES